MVVGYGETDGEVVESEGDEGEEGEGQKEELGLVPADQDFGLAVFLSEDHGDSLAVVGGQGVGHRRSVEGYRVVGGGLGALGRGVGVGGLEQVLPAAYVRSVLNRD